ncbi:MAG: tetratricopeptide repeat protein [Chloroflexi bacterium]|nr:MAG: tetratricopeptide repeat protein [Chloroflexota bacterium]
MTTSSSTSSTKNRPLILAKQHDQKGEYKKASRLYRLAGEYAFASYENDIAQSCFSRALELTPDAQFEARYSLMFWLERIYTLTGQLERRSQNLTALAAMADALDRDKKRAEVAARLALYKLDNGDNQDVISIVRLAVRIAQTASATAAEAALNLTWGRALQRLTEFDAAQQRLQRALSLAKEHDLPELEADSYRYLGVVCEENGRYPQAKSLYKQALALYETTHNRRGQSNMLNNLGKIAYDQGEYTAALRYWDHAITSYFEIGDKPGRCRVLINQSAIRLNLGDYDQAKIHNDAALKLSREIGLRFGECLSLINLGLIHHYLTDQEAAILYANQALSLSVEMGSKRLEGFAHQTLGNMLRIGEQYGEAADHFWEAVAIWHEMEQPALLMESEAGLADVALATGELAEAMVHIESIFDKLNSIANLDGAESPFTVYLICHNVLAATKDARANKILHQAHKLLTERANAIIDDNARTLFLKKVKSHRQIIELFASLILN